MLHKDTSIQRKLIKIILFTSGAVLLLTCSAFFAYEFLTFRQTTITQLSTLAEVIATNSTAALAFQDQNDGQEILTAIKAEKHIVAASLYDKQGRLFARYPAGLPAGAFPVGPGQDGYRFDHSYLIGFEPIVQGDHRLGTLYLKSDMAAMYERFRLYAVISVAVITVSSLLAVMLSKRLQHQISDPILALADTARAISIRRDYSVRATKHSDDELGALTDAFNQMLTQIHQQDEAVRESAERVRAVLNSAISAVFVVDSESKIIDWNARAEEMFGWTRSEALGRDMAETIIPSRYREANRRAIERFLTRGECPVLNRLIEMSALHRNGDEFPAEFCLSPMKTAGVVTFCGFVTDITERKKTAAAVRAQEKAESANKAKSEFLSRVSHELRTPLNAILGFGQLLERHNPTDTQRARLRHVNAAGRHLLKLINEVLEISRIEAGQLPLSLEPVCVADALQDALDLIRPLAAERGITLSTPSQPDPGAFVLADLQRLKQVLLNLFSNAVKYTPGRGEVTVSCNSSDNNILRIVVSDTGVGIPAERLARLFTPFDRLGAEQSSVEGTGLGLALSQRLMQAMGGSIGAESIRGKGSTFWIELPRTQSPLVQSSPQRTEGPEPECASRNDKSTILYIEDNLSNLTLVEEILAEQSEVKLISAMQGQIGLDLARQHLPDLILLDLHLPDLHGREVLGQLRRDAATRHIPVVVISADATTRQINDLMAAGAHSYLTKPLDVAQFAKVVEEATLTGRTKESKTV